MDVPILIIAWRRPNTLKEVIDALRPVAPSILFVACDGPNHSRIGEAEKVAATRRVIETKIDWPCQIERLYSESNQGCKLGVSRAISWFFDHVSEGIILEDDCVPHPDFFPYCTTLLDRYRNDSRVWCISGSNFQNGQWRGDGSYYFSRYNHCWGWASWRRCWQHYDHELRLLDRLLQSDLLKTVFDDSTEQEYWCKIWNRLCMDGEPDTWDYQWTFTCFINGGLTTIPNRNLVRNIGFGTDATHTLTPSLTTDTFALNTIKHPEFILRDYTADRYTCERVFSIQSPSSTYSRRAKLIRLIRDKLRFSSA